MAHQNSPCCSCAVLTASRRHTGGHMVSSPCRTARSRSPPRRPSARTAPAHPRGASGFWGARCARRTVGFHGHPWDKQEAAGREQGAACKGTDVEGSGNPEVYGKRRDARCRVYGYGWTLNPINTLWYARRRKCWHMAHFTWSPAAEQAGEGRAGEGGRECARRRRQAARRGCRGRTRRRARARRCTRTWSGSGCPCPRTRRTGTGAAGSGTRPRGCTSTRSPPCPPLRAQGTTILNNSMLSAGEQGSEARPPGCASTTRSPACPPLRAQGQQGGPHQAEASAA